MNRLKAMLYSSLLCSVLIEMIQLSGNVGGTHPW